MRLTIGTKLVGLITALLLCSEIMLVTLSTYLFIDDNTALIQQMNADSALSLATQMRAHFEGFSDRMHLLGEVWIRETQSASKQPSVVRDFFEKHPEFMALQLYGPTPEGKTEIRSEYYSPEASGALRTSVIAREWKIGDEDILVAPAALGKISGLAVGIPLAGGKHLMVGWFALSRFAKAFSSRHGAKSYLFDEGGKVLIGGDGLEKVSTWPSVKRLVASKLTNGQTRYEEHSGEKKLVAFRTVGMGGLTVVTEVAESKAFEAVRRLQVRAGLVAIVVLFISFIAGYFFSETITSPVRDLLSAAESIAGGEFRVRLEPRSNDELADLSQAFNEMAKGLEERVHAMETLDRFHGKEIAQKLLSSNVRLGGEAKEATILFVDIRDFTSLTERMAPENVVEMVNEYFTRMVGIIRAYGGVVDKYIGDAIMALWGVPKEHDDDVQRAVRCCLEMREELERLNVLRVSRMQSPLRIGMGLNTGKVIAGNIGSAKKMEYTVLGDPVNVASRIQSATKSYLTDLLVSKSVYERTSSRFLYQPCRLVKVKGKSEELEVYRVFGYVDSMGRRIEVIEPDMRKKVA